MPRLTHYTPTHYSARRILGWLWNILHRHRLQAILNTLTESATVLLDFAFIAATKYTIDVATHKAEGTLTTGAACLIGILLSQLAIRFASRWIRALLGVKAQNLMQATAFARILHSEWNEMNRRHSGDVLNRLERDTADVVNTVTETAPSIIAVSIRLTGAFLFLYSMDAALACLTTAIIPIFILLSKLYMRRMRRLTRDIRCTDSRIQSILQETIQHRTLIQTLERQDYMVKQLDNVQKTLRAQIRTRTIFSSSSSTLLSAGFMACYLITFLWGATRLYEGTITYGMMIAFIQLVGQIQGPFRDLSRFIPIFVNAFTAGERLMELEEIPQEQMSGTSLAPDDVPGIRFENVSYAYTPQGRRILNRFSFDFPPGSHTAVVGETGAGKTTLIRLMLSLIRPMEGQIILYGSHGRESACNAGTRPHFTFVPQGNTLFSGTIRDNLRLGNPQATEEDMREALTCACADFVFRLPDGLDTACSESGGGLSEGQAQRIAIARALLRPGGILLLDEATSSLDSDTENRLWTNLSHRCQGKTLIFITHRTGIISPDTRTLRLERTNIHHI